MVAVSRCGLSVFRGEAPQFSVTRESRRRDCRVLRAQPQFFGKIRFGRDRIFVGVQTHHRPIYPLGQVKESPYPVTVDFEIVVFGRRAPVPDNNTLQQRCIYVEAMEVDRLLDACVQDAELLEFTMLTLPEPFKTDWGATVAQKLLHRFEQTGSLGDLDRAITANEQAVASTPYDHPDRAGRVNNLGIALQRRFERTGSMTDLDRSITMIEDAVTSNPDDRPSHAAMRNNLGLALWRRFERTGSMDELDRAISVLEQAVISTPDDHPDRVMYLINLGTTLRSRFVRTGSMDDLDRAIAISEQAVASVQEGNPDRAPMLNNLGIALHSRFERTGSMDDLDRAITMNQLAATSTPNDHADHAMYLCNLGIALRSRFERTGSMEDLNWAITTDEQAVASTPDDHPDRVIMLTTLGNALRSRFVRTGSVEDLDRAISTNKRAVTSIPNDHPDRAMYLSNLGSALQTRFDRIGSMDDLDQAILIEGQSVATTPENHPSLPGRLHNLGTALQSRFKRMGRIGDLDQAIATEERAVAAVPDDHPDRAIMFNSLGDALQRRFERTGLMDDLEKAIATNERAVASTPDNHPNRAGRLDMLGTALHLRFQRTGSMDDLDRAIATNEQAVISTPDDHPDRAARLNNLANPLHSRFERTGSMDDLNRAITTYDLAVQSTPDDHPDRSGRINNLGCALQSRFERTGSMDDLDRAIITNEQAVTLTPNNNPDRAARLNNLGIALQSRFQRIGSIDDLNRAVTTSEEAVASIPDDHLNHATMLNNLGIALQRRYERTGSVEDLDLAIRVNEQAVASIPDDHPDRAAQLYNLGRALQSRFERIGSTDDLERAITSIERAVWMETAPPSIRLKAASSCSDLLIAQKDYNRAKPILLAAVHLLPTISSRTLKRSDQQYNISQFANITSRAVALCLGDAEDPYKPLQLLELGRGILISLQLEVRSDISVLAASYPDLAKNFQELRDRIDSPETLDLSVIVGSSLTSNPPSTVDPSKPIAERRALIKQFENLLRSIRSLQGFENFLQGPSKSELLSLAKDGPIVVFNVSELRSDAFLLEGNRIRQLQLPSLKQTELDKISHRFLNAVQNATRVKTYSNSKSEILEILAWLWNVAVEPVLDELGFTKTPSEKEAWPRLWWVSSGLLTMLPIHAAGYHSPGSLRNALDRVISSYAPTLKSLAYAWEKLKKSEAQETQKALLIAMPKTTAMRDLPFAEKEIHELQDLLPSVIQITVTFSPTRADTLSLIQEHQIVHLACHAQVSSEDPSQSKIFLSDWTKAPLTFSELTSLNIPISQFAYLSACHTSSTRNPSLLDESISLSSAFQLAGYPSVIGTLWQVHDEYSPTIGKKVYHFMLNGCDRVNTRRSAEGLHRAIRSLKDKTRAVPGTTRRVTTDPLVWASYIHLGV